MKVACRKMIETGLRSDGRSGEKLDSYDSERTKKWARSTQQRCDWQDRTPDRTTACELRKEAKIKQTNKNFSWDAWKGKNTAYAERRPTWYIWFETIKNEVAGKRSWEPRHRWRGNHMSDGARARGRTYFLRQCVFVMVSLPSWDMLTVT